MGTYYLTFFYILMVYNCVLGFQNLQNFREPILDLARGDLLNSSIINDTFKINNYDIINTINNVKNDLISASKTFYDFKQPAFSWGKSNTCPKIHPPDNSVVVCQNKGICTIKCNAGYYTKNGDTVLTYVCKNKNWVKQSSNKEFIEQCLPKCEFSCLNGGKCLMPNVCQCVPNYYGSSCEIAKVLCETLPPESAYSYRKCDSENCTVSCMGGKKFPDGSSSVNLTCQNGEWIFLNKQWTSMPNCEVVCNPQCINGGKCIDTNVCFCPEEFRGDFCQYSIDNCDASKLNFNGNFNCSGDEMSFSCQLSCPKGTISTREFQKQYTCLYSEGVFIPADIPQCEIEQERKSSDATIETGYNNSLFVINGSSVPNTCMIWGSNIKTLSNKVISFKSNCIFTLIEDKLEYLFHIQIHFNYFIISEIIIYINDVQYFLSKNDVGKPVFSIGNTGQQLSIPSQLTDLKIEISSGNSVIVYLPAVNVYLVWNLKDELRVDISDAFSNRTGGLCGNTNNSSSIQLQKYVSDAVVSSVFDKCDAPIEEEEQCSPEDTANARNICKKLNDDPIFEACRQILKIDEYLAACEFSYCNCEKTNRMDCICQFFSKFVENCVQQIPNLKINWRDHFDCALRCPANQMYTSCMPVSQATCASDQIKPTALKKYCEEGCVCASGMVLYEDKCINKDVCPCMYGGKFYDQKSVIAKDCNKCTCMRGKWSCTEAICKAECLVFGDAHYETFDGKKYEFSGSCSYKLVVTDDVIVEIVNSVCNKCKKLRPSTNTKYVIVHIGSETITLKELQKIFVNNIEVEELPAIICNNTYVRKASSLLTHVVLPNGLEILWNGKNRLQVFANASLYGKTKGLCGTFNSNQQDDLLSPEGDVEKNVVAFANKWRTNENCESEKIYEASNACEIHIQNKDIAEKYCSNLTGSIFADCHSSIDPISFYENCLNDLCVCEENDVADCFCPILSVYAQECAKIGIVINWRKSIRACGIPCPYGQEFETCGVSCQRTCADISHGELCKNSCTEGCYCPAGYTFNEDDECIPISKCSCIYQGQKYPPGSVEVLDESTAWECKNALWISKKPTKEEIEKYNNKTSCPSNMKYVECEPHQPVTCRNMHDPPQFSENTCHSGCICDDEYVLESVSKSCIKPISCPCHHGGRSYFEGESIQQECNNCTCIKSKWKCSNNECASICSTWGDSHFRTFDGRFYDVQGTCDYVFAKGFLSNSEIFSIYIEIVPCGTGGTSCTKSIIISSGSSDNAETIKLDRDKHFDSTKIYEKFDIVPTGLYVIIMFKGLSVSLQWDKGTRVSLKAHPKWKNHMTGLCGNYNGNALDDFQTPAGGLVEVDSSVFVDSWKLQQYCPFPSQIKDSCALHPHRKFWSVMKCSQLKDSQIFKRCHSEVPVEDYYKRCVFDSCACDEGGDCECLCTVFAAYAQECSAKGVSLKWRSQELCPIQCELGARYSSCVSPCTIKTSCDNIHGSETFFQQCRYLPCVEGCEKRKCPDRKVFRNSTSDECISPNDCDCMVINGKVYKENDKISSDECHSCYCSKGKKVCIGIPCAPSQTYSTCVDGWSTWKNIVFEYKGILNKNKLPFDDTTTKINCTSSEIKAVRCRSQNVGSTWKNVNCDFGKKIQCIGNCVKFQIQLYCECGTTTPTPAVPVDKCINCNQLCHYFKTKVTGQNDCQTPKICVNDSLNVNCSADTFWRDPSTCVSKDACTCSSRNGTLVTPAMYITEEDCSICQCVHNEYVCTPASCGSTVNPLLTTMTQILPEKPDTTTEIKYSTSSVSLEFPLCDPESLFPIDIDAKYSGSSGIPGFEPWKAKLITSSGKTVQNKHDWTAEISTNNQYLEVDLINSQPIYGIMIAGNPITEDYVKSYKISYSIDCYNYYDVLSVGGSDLFRGPYDPKIPETQLFKEPVEGRCVRIIPFTWKNTISMLVRILGCIVDVTPTGRCLEPMGVESGALKPEQITFSSKMDNFTASDLSLSSPTGWAPFVASSNQWIQFDFFGNRIIDGIVMKGSATANIIGDAWIKTYRITYKSDDDENWNSMFDTNGTEKIFSGNINNINAHINKFVIPLRTRFLRIHPISWNVYPVLRIEILGCYESYVSPTSLPFVPTPSPVTLPPSNTPINISKLCRNIAFDNQTKICENETYWDGEECVKKEFCPCVEGLLHYKVGSSYIKDKCDWCICSLGGNPLCHPAIENCSQCTDKDLRRIIYENCTCGCVSCPPGTRLCPSSGKCLNESLWCNGYHECPDDETGCKVLIPPPRRPNLCPEPLCPEGYIPSIIQNSSKSLKNDLLNQLKNKIPLRPMSFVKTVNLKSLTTYTWGNQTIFNPIDKVLKYFESLEVTNYMNFQNKQAEFLDPVACIDWNCLSVVGVNCTKPKCPTGTKLVTKRTDDTCPVYECITFSIMEKECTIYGGLITTFDGLTYKYDICDHILAEDKMFGTWKVRKIDKCFEGASCVSSLVINHKDDLIEIFTNFTVLYNGYHYTVVQFQAIGSKNESFVVKPVSTKFVIFASVDLKFGVIWGSDSSVIVLVHSSLYGMIDGLCGYFDFNVKNDKTKSDGKITVNTEDFGNSWKYGNDSCKTKTCLKDIQIKDKEICQIFKSSPFDKCDFTMNVDSHIDRCIESLCLCSTSDSVDFDKDCRCPVLQKFAEKCQFLQPGVDLSLWRLKYDCPVNCTAPFVYQDCYDRNCEPGCDSLQQKDQCPRIENKCFPGCYCPEGLIRKGDMCIKPTECRDCICSGNNLQLTTFDQVQIPLYGMCTPIILLHTTNSEALEADIKIILTPAKCVSPYVKNTVCVRGITIIIGKKEILLYQGNQSLAAMVDNIALEKLPYADGQIIISESPGMSISLSVPSLQLDVNFMANNKGFSIQLPSYLYSEKIKGVCGTCNQNQTDDIKKISGELAVKFDDFLDSWSTKRPNGTEKWKCKPPYIPPLDCTDKFMNNSCLLLLDKTIFGKCHAIIDPLPYVDMCKNYTCKGISYCQILATYAEECYKNEICLQWRNANLCPFKCPKGFEYKACIFNCDINCDNVDLYRSGAFFCSKSVSEKCVCPQNQVLKNGTCTDELKCRPCDNSNHYIGDKWMPDNCTTCECVKDGSVSCQKKQCPSEMVCPVGMKAVVSNNSDDFCCLKHVCVNEETTGNCTTPIKIECAKNQIIKLDVTPLNCTQYICVCISPEECPQAEIDKNVELLPGMVQKEKKEGCCPSIEIVCDPSTCPTPMKCPQFYERKQVNNSQSCCPSDTCELPENTCIYEYQWIADDNGRERQRLPSEVYTELKNFSDTWFDGPCRLCGCINDSLRAVCSNIKCVEPPEQMNYVIKPFYDYGQCCPSYKAIACKINNVVYEVNSTWTVENEPCKTMSCVKNTTTDEISLKEIIATCDHECKSGWIYQEPNNISTDCCGSCKQIACIDDDGILHYPSSTWQSKNKCISYECDKKLNILIYTEICPDVSYCPPTLLYSDGCCKKCKIPSGSKLNCNAISLPLNETVALISKKVFGHGVCSNREEIKGFTKCDGICSSFSFFDEYSLKFSNECHCCVGDTYSSKKIKLTCKDGYTYEENVDYPSSCKCHLCGNSSPSLTTKKSFDISKLFG